MASWRENASPQVQEDADKLFAHAMKLASISLSKGRELYPFMVRINLDGDTSIEMMDPGPGDSFDGEELAAAHWELLRGTRDKYRAVDLVLDVFIRAERSDAVSVLFEHRDGLALVLNTRYAPKRFPKKFRTGKTSVELGSQKVWPES